MSHMNSDVCAYTMLWVMERGRVGDSLWLIPAGLWARGNLRLEAPSAISSWLSPAEPRGFCFGGLLFLGKRQSNPRIAHWPGVLCGFMFADKILSRYRYYLNRRRDLLVFLCFPYSAAQMRNSGHHSPFWRSAHFWCARMIVDQFTSNPSTMF